MLLQSFLLIVEFSEKLWQGNPKLRMCTGQKLVDYRPVPMLLQLLQKQRRHLAPLVTTCQGCRAWLQTH